MRRTLLAGLLALIASPLAAQPPASPPPASKPIDIGPAVGARIPTLAARDQTGAARSLDSIVGKKGVTLVFFRSARWCPFCQHQLIGLKDVAAGLAAKGYPIAAISYDAPDALAAFAEKQSIGYTLLSDDGSKMIDAFKLRDPQYPVGNFAYGVPRPSIFIVDRSGVVRAKLAEDGYKVRPTNEALMAAVDGLK